ncbi:MAG: hypothetical protein EPO21_03925 [Chloroflexota bacterium]|nr:MAG: hypothetical protein EPO21_03925 [Chloroflexota bacterium]
MTSILFAMSLAVVVFSGTFLALERGVVGVTATVTRRGRWSSALRRASARPVSSLLAEDEYLGLLGVNWIVLQIGGAVTGVLVLAVVFAESTPQLAVTGLAGALIPRLAKGHLLGRARERHLSEVRDFVGALRLMVGMGETLSRSLMRLSQANDDSIFGRRLRYHVSTKLASSPEVVIEALAQDFRSRELENLLLRLRASQRGGLASQEAVRSTAEEVEAEVAEQVELAIEEAPTKMVLPMLVGLFPSILVLLLYPLAHTFLAGLKGGL